MANRAAGLTGALRTAGAALMAVSLLGGCESVGDQAGAVPDASVASGEESVGEVLGVVGALAGAVLLGQSMPEEHRAAVTQALVSAGAQAATESGGPASSAVAQATAAIVTQKTAHDEVQRANAAYEAHKAGDWMNRPAGYHEQGAALLQTKMNAESSLKAGNESLVWQAQYSEVASRIQSEGRQSGGSAPRGTECLHSYDQGSPDDNLMGYESWHFVNLCPGLQVAVFTCSYGSSDGACAPSGEHIGYNARYRYGWKDQPDSGGDVNVKAFCLAGSHPENFSSLDGTGSHGQARYNCVWD